LKERHNKGSLLKHEGTPIDITTQRLVESADWLQAETEQILRKFMDEAPVAFAVFDSKLNYVDVNKAALDLIGLARNEVLGKHILEVNPGLEATGRYDKYLEVIRTGKSMTFEDIAPVPRFGDLRLWLKVFKIGDGLGIVTSDITKRVKEAQTLKFQSEVLSQVSDVVIGTDNENRITYWNKAAEESYGVGSDEAIGHKLEDVYHYSWLKPEDEQAAYNSLETKGVWQGENIHFTRNGEVKYVESTVSVTRATDGTHTGLLAVIRDITKRKLAERAAAEMGAELEKRVEKRTEELRAVNKRLRSLATQLSLAQAREQRRLAALLHDSVNQSLASFAMKMDVLIQQTSSTRFEKPLREIYEGIQQSIGEMRTLTFHLSPPILYEMGLEAAIEELARRYQQEYGLECLVHTDGESKPLDRDISILLYESIRELLWNVIKHAQAHRVIIETIKLGDELRIQLEDDGIGVDPEIILGRRRSKGFGLFSIRERLNDIGGHIEAESMTNGSHIVLIVPLNKV